MGNQSDCSLSLKHIDTLAIGEPSVGVTADADPNKLSFLDLPGEIRNKIYELAYEESSREARKRYSRRNRGFTAEENLPPLEISGSAVWFFSTPGLWGVSKRVRAEAKHFCPREHGEITAEVKDWQWRRHWLQCRTILEVPHVGAFGPVIQLQISYDELHSGCCDNYWSDRAKKWDHYPEPHPEAHKERLEHAKRWTEPKHPLLACLRLICENMPHLRHLSLEICTQAMRALDSSLTEQEEDGVSYDSKDGPMLDDGQWKNTLLIKSLAGFRGLRSLKCSHPNIRPHSWGCPRDCPSWKKVTDYLKWRMLASSSYDSEEVVAARGRLWEIALKTWPDPENQSYGHEWFHDLNDEYVGLFEDCLPTSKLFKRRLLEDDSADSECTHGQTQRTHPILPMKPLSKPRPKRGKEKKGKKKVDTDLRRAYGSTARVKAAGALIPRLLSTCGRGTAVNA